MQWKTRCKCLKAALKCTSYFSAALGDIRDRQTYLIIEKIDLNIQVDIT